MNNKNITNEEKLFIEYVLNTTLMEEIEDYKTGRFPDLCDSGNEPLTPEDKAGKEILYYVKRSIAERNKEILKRIKKNVKYKKALDDLNKNFYVAYNNTFGVVPVNSFNAGEYPGDAVKSLSPQKDFETVLSEYVEYMLEDFYK